MRRHYVVEPHVDDAYLSLHQVKAGEENGLGVVAVERDCFHSRYISRLSLSSSASRDRTPGPRRSS